MHELVHWLSLWILRLKVYCLSDLISPIITTLDTPMECSLPRIGLWRHQCVSVWRHRAVAPTGPTIQGRQDQLVGRRLWLRHELHPGGGRLRAAGGRGRPQTGQSRRLHTQTGSCGSSSSSFVGKEGEGHWRCEISVRKLFSRSKFTEKFSLHRQNKIFNCVHTLFYFCEWRNNSCNAY